MLGLPNSPRVGAQGLPTEPSPCPHRAKVNHCHLASEAPLWTPRGRLDGRHDWQHLGPVVLLPPLPLVPRGWTPEEVRSKSIHVETGDQRVLMPQRGTDGGLTNGSDVSWILSDGEPVGNYLKNLLIVFSRVQCTGENRADTSEKGFELQVAT